MALQRDGSRYYWRVRAATADQTEYQWSKTAYFELLIDASCTAVLAAPTVSGIIEKCRNATATINLPAVAVQGAANVATKPLAATGSRYYWRVRAGNDSTTTTWSAPAYFEIVVPVSGSAALAPVGVTGAIQINRWVTGTVALPAVGVTGNASSRPQGDSHEAEGEIALSPIAVNSRVIHAEPLRYYERRYWRMRARDANGVVSEYSPETAFFETGRLDLTATATASLGAVGVFGSIVQHTTNPWGTARLAPVGVAGEIGVWRYHAVSGAVTLAPVEANGIVNFVIGAVTLPGVGVSGLTHRETYLTGALNLGPVRCRNWSEDEGIKNKTMQWLMWAWRHKWFRWR